MSDPCIFCGCKSKPKKGRCPGCNEAVSDFKPDPQKGEMQIAKEIFKNAPKTATVTKPKHDLAAEEISAPIVGVDPPEPTYETGKMPKNYPIRTDLTKKGSDGSTKLLVSLGNDGKLTADWDEVIRSIDEDRKPEEPIHFQPILRLLIATERDAYERGWRDACEAHTSCSPKYRHKKRGTVYELIYQDTIVQCEQPLQDGDVVCFYQEDYGSSSFVRKPAEFFDGRFEKVQEDGKA